MDVYPGTLELLYMYQRIAWRNLTVSRSKRSAWSQLSLSNIPGDMVSTFHGIWVHVWLWLTVTLTIHACIAQHSRSVAHSSEEGEAVSLIVQRLMTKFSPSFWTECMPACPHARTIHRNVCPDDAVVCVSLPSDEQVPKHPQKTPKKGWLFLINNNIIPLQSCKVWRVSPPTLFVATTWAVHQNVRKVWEWCALTFFLLIGIGVSKISG